MYPSLSFAVKKLHIAILFPKSAIERHNKNTKPVLRGFQYIESLFVSFFLHYREIPTSYECMQSERSYMEEYRCACILLVEANFIQHDKLCS